MQNYKIIVTSFTVVEEVRKVKSLRIILVKAIQKLSKSVKIYTATFLSPTGYMSGAVFIRPKHTPSIPIAKALGYRYLCLCHRNIASTTAVFFRLLLLYIRIYHC